MYATASVTGVTQAWKPLRGDAADQQRSRRPRKARFALTVDRPGHRLVQPRLAVSADVQESAERLPPGSAADAHRHEAEVPAVPRRQLSRRRQIADRFEWKKTLGPLVGSSRPHGALDLPLVRRPRPSRVPALGRAHERRAGARRLRRLLAEGRVREARTRSRAVRPGRARRDRIRHRPGRRRSGERCARKPAIPRRSS